MSLVGPIPDSIWTGSACTCHPCPVHDQDPPQPEPSHSCGWCGRDTWAYEAVTGPPVDLEPSCRYCGSDLETFASPLVAPGRG